MGSVKSTKRDMYNTRAQGTAILARYIDIFRQGYSGDTLLVISHLFIFLQVIMS